MIDDCEKQVRARALAEELLGYEQMADMVEEGSEAWKSLRKQVIGCLKRTKTLLEDRTESE